MSVNLPPVPHNIPLLNPLGVLSPRWSAWFKLLISRVGGNEAQSNDEIQARFPVQTTDIGDAQVTPAKLSASVAGTGLSGGAGSALSVGVDNSTIEHSGNSLRVKDGSLSFVKFLASDWSSSKANSGYLKLPSGLYIQWGVTGTLASGSDTTVTFPTAFPTSCLQVLVGVRDNSGTVTTTTGQPGTGNYSASNFHLYNRTSAGQVFNWMAIGH